MKKKLVIIFIITISVLLLIIYNNTINDLPVDSALLITPTSVSLEGTSFEDLEIPENYDLRQYQGMTLNFIVENNIFANILLHEAEEFSGITGIDINVKAVDYDILNKKVNLDLIGKEGNYQIIYVDPYQTLNRFYDYLEVLNPYNENDKIPNIKMLETDFFDYQIQTISNFENEDNIYSIPFDSTTMILFYRKDIFEKYEGAFYEDYGYNWNPESDDFTWERYIEVSEWINNNVPNEEVHYGSGQMAQKHNSIFCDFSSVLAAYGGDYFLDEGINTYGLKGFENINVTDESFIKALNVYKDIIAAASPESIQWNWTDSALAFRNSEIAMMTNWDENATYLENEESSLVAGKIGYAKLPRGSVRSANIFGGSGIGINKYATEQEKQAAWLFIVWATSKDIQLKALNHKEGGSLPTRISAYENIDNSPYIKDAGGDKGEIEFTGHVAAVYDAWQTENIYLRPKTSNFYLVEEVLINALNDMLQYDLEAEAVSERIKSELMDILIKSQESR